MSYLYIKYKYVNTEISNPFTIQIDLGIFGRQVVHSIAVLNQKFQQVLSPLICGRLLIATSFDSKAYITLIEELWKNKTHHPPAFYNVCHKVYRSKFVWREVQGTLNREHFVQLRLGSSLVADFQKFDADTVHLLIDRAQLLLKIIMKTPEQPIK